MPTANALSNNKTLRKGKARAGTPPAPKKRGGRKKGAVKWTIVEYIRLFRIISEIRPSGNNHWQQVMEEHNLGPTERSLDACKTHWFPVLKLKKPTGGTRTHPLHRLALSIDDDINKSNGTHVMNDEDDHDPYLEIKLEFKRAEDEMRRYKMDFNRPPNFNIPMPDEDAVVDEEDMAVEELSEVESDGGSDHGDGGDGKTGDDKVVEDGGHGTGLVRSLSEAPTELDDPKEQVDLQDVHHSSSWDLEVIAGPSAPSAPKTLAPKSPKKLSAGDTSIDPPPRKRPDMKPKRQPTPEQGAPSTTPNKSKATGASNTPSVDVANRLAKSNKRKAVDEGDREARKASSSKKQLAKPKESDEDIINLVSDDDDRFVSSYIDKKSEGNMASIAFMDHKRKIQRLESKLEDANAKNRALEIEIINLKQDAKVQELVKAELAKYHPQRLQPLPTNPTPAHLDNPFDPNHPFNQPAPDDDMVFGAPNM
ncbi:hypothetical protein RSOL_456650, partial [Rhizoctonia solani AG-3 Rhs1AP]